MSTTDDMAFFAAELNRGFLAIWDRAPEAQAAQAFAADEDERQTFADTLRKEALASFAKRVEFQQYVEAAPDTMVTRRELREILVAAGVL